ncbi:MAG: topoisomerase C-terminal repeat-containing protein [Clostridia bacterium]|nr:topoisomerase C-terminal repeat-containing protein [Clostridia bacterium]
MVLIIAEKPSLARNIVAGIEYASAESGKNGRLTKRDGYFEGCGYLVSWAFGHLFSLCDIESYLPPEKRSERWTMDNLPCFPAEFRFELRREGKDGKVDSGVKRQFSTLQALCNRDDVDTIANAGDADREGEIIVRLCIQHALTAEKAPSRKLVRLWLPDQTPQTVARALSEMKDESEYDNLAGEGFARTYIDWLYGVNLTRYATLRMGSLLRVGRVIIPIVRAIYDRDMAIKNFVPGKYFAVVSKELTDGEEIELTSKKKFEDDSEAVARAAAQALCDKYNALDAIVTSVKNKKDKLPPGKLYSLSKLQNVLSKRYKMSMSDSLEIVQKLYEQGYLTYPRTNSEYLATAEKDKMKQIIANIAKVGYPVTFKDSKTIFDDSKIESHSALTPTYKIPDKSQLSEREMQVYSTVFRRFVAVFCAEDCIVSRTEITIAVGDEETFTLKGMVMLEKGWTKYDDFTQKDKTLPALKKGDRVVTCFKPVEKETSPPRHHTIESLNNYLKNPFREEKAAGSDLSTLADRVGEDDAEEYRAILEGIELGTEATRTGIIDNARNSRYIELKKDVYTILPDGIFLIESLERLHINMDKYKTSDMGRALKRVFRGQMSIEDSVALATSEIASVFEQSGKHEDDIGFFGDVVGKCPKCGEDVKRFRTFYGCSGYKEKGCKFSINLVIAGRTVSRSHVDALLRSGETDVIEGFYSPRTGRRFEAALRLDEDGRAVFDRIKGEVDETDYGLCPLCGGEIRRNSKFYGCSRYRENGCKFNINTVICGREITSEHITALLTDGKTEVLEGFVSPRSGKAFSAALKLVNGNVEFDFDRARPAAQSNSTPSYTPRNLPPPEENPFPPAFYDGN